MARKFEMLVDFHNELFQPIVLVKLVSINQPCTGHTQFRIAAKKCET